LVSHSKGKTQIEDYTPPNTIRVIKLRRMRWAGHVAHMGDVRSAYNIVVGEPEQKRPFGRPRHRWEDNIMMDIREIGWAMLSVCFMFINFVFQIFSFFVIEYPTSFMSYTVQIISIHLAWIMQPLKFSPLPLT
jgi:hypothetical protein